MPRSLESSDSSGSEDEDGSFAGGGRQQHRRDSRLPSAVRPRRESSSDERALRTMRLLSLEVGSLKAELLRERQKRTAAVERAEVAEAAQQSARERAAELQFATSRLAAQVEGLREEAAAKGRRVRQLSSSLAATDADMSTRVARGQLQVGGGLACVLC